MWNLAESNLQYTRADVFEIFDCCYAGDLGRGRRFTTRHFEFLGATSAGSTTRGPGKHSFSSGLIWALKELAENNERFTTSQLTNKIRDCPDFPKRQVPTLIERNEASVERIILAPLSRNGNLQGKGEEASENISKNQELLILKFVLDKCPEKSEIVELAKGVNLMIQAQAFVVRQVVWGGLYPWPDVGNPLVREAAKRFKLGLSRQREQSRNQQNPIYLQPPSPMSFHGPDPSEPVTPLTSLEDSGSMSQSVVMNPGGVAPETATSQMARWFEITLTYFWTTPISREGFLLIGFLVYVLLTNRS